MKYILIFLLALSFNFCAQISIDSLKAQLSSHYSKTGTNEYLMETFTKFESLDKLDRYDVYLDSNNNIVEFIGLSIVHYLFDNQKRLILIEGFDSLGNNNFWDFPPIQKLKYIIDTLEPKLNSIKNEICKCHTHDLLNTVIITKQFYANKMNDLTRYSVISSDSSKKLTFAINHAGELQKGEDKVAYIFREYHKTYKNIIIQERFYNSKLKLINDNHLVFKNDYVAIYPDKSYSFTKREIENGEITKIDFYNKKGKLVDVFNLGNINKPHY